MRESNPWSLRNSRLCAAAWLATALFGAAPNPGFRSPHLQHDHFVKYGSQFGKITEAQYVHMAQQLRDAAEGKNVLASKRQDGGGSKFDVKKGWFVAYDADMTVRTFFIPKDGEKYFERQKKSGTPPE